jgi:opacity protein-like surface antigen
MTYRRFLVLTALALVTLLSAYAADPTGKWAAEFDTAIGVQKYTYDLKADDAKLTGTATNQSGATQIQEGKVNGDEITFVEMLKFEGQDIRIEYTGKVSGDEIKFVRKVGDFATEEFVAKRLK